MSKFTIEQIERIAALAKLELSDAEKRQFAEQFDAILGYVAVIQQVPLPEEAQMAQESNPVPLREDVVEPFGLGPDAFSPYLEHGQFKVPKVIE